MSVPRSVVKFSKNGVTYTSNVDFVQYSIIELTRAALRDVGKFLARSCNTEGMKLRGLKKSRRVRGRTSTFRYKVPWAKTGLPHLEIGATHATWYGEQQELGSSGQPKRGIIRNTVYNNIAKIVEIESKYLSALESEAAALAAISEEEYSGGGDDD